MPASQRIPVVLLGFVAVFTIVADVAEADTAGRLATLVGTPAVSGYESHLRGEIEMLLPPGARVRADSIGNIVMRTGSGAPHTLVVAPLDESGYVVSAITDDGYLRVHRHTTAPDAALATQFFIGQPVMVITASGSRVPGVSATPSAHLRGLRDAPEEARIKSIDDIWIDVGAESRAEVEKLGVRLMDSVSLRERVARLAGSQVSGVAASNRAAALAIVEIIRRSTGRGATGTVTLAWMTQAEFGQRGLLRLLETYEPDRLIALRGAGVDGLDARGGIARLGAGALIAPASAVLTAAAAQIGTAVQPAPDSFARMRLPDRWKSLDVHIASVPVLFAHTPVETVDARDVDALAAVVAAVVGLGPLGDAPDGENDDTPRRTPAADPISDRLRPLIEAYGVSAHEAPVRDEIVKQLPTWAKPHVDERGNLRVTFGAGKPLLFVAHMDEVGFEIVSIDADGSAAVRTRGGMYLSVYEAHPVVVLTKTGRVPAVLSPRRGYLTATASQPEAAELALYFGTQTAGETAALAVATGDSVTVRKELTGIGTHRATGRSMDDRVGSAALLMALHRIDPARITNQVTFAWSVEEETGLAGAAFMATQIKADTVFAVDTFVSTDTPVDIQRLAGARLGEGAVLRVLDSRTIVPPHIVDRVAGLAREARIPLQLGTTRGGTDASAFSAAGAIDVGLSWPGRYSHSPVEVMDRRDVEALVRLIVAIANAY